MEISAQTEDMSDAQRQSFLSVAHGIEELNRMICAAVDTGLSIELQRSCRHHAGGGYWGDIMSPRIVKKAGEPG